MPYHRGHSRRPIPPFIGRAVAPVITSVTLTDTPSAVRHGGPDGVLAIDVVLTDTPSAIRHGGPDGAVAIGVSATDTPSAIRHGGPDGALVLADVYTDTPSAIRHGGPDGTAQVDLAVTDTPSAVRYGGPDGAVGEGITLGPDTPSAIRHGGPDGTVQVDLAVTAAPSGIRFGGPSGSVVMLPTRTPYVSPAPIDTPGYALWVADTVTGRMLWELPLETMSWSMALGQIGTITATIDVEKTWDSLSDQDERDPRILVREVLTGPWRFCLVVVWGALPVWAGPYISLFRPSPSKVQLGGAEISKIFAKRIAIKPGASGPTDPLADTVIGPGTSKGHAAAVLLTQAMTGTGYSLPITVTDPGGAGIDYRTYHGYDLAKYADLLSNLATETDGPELRFDPVITAGSDANYLSWIAQIGTPYVGLSTAPWVFDDDVSVITGLDADASAMTMNLYSGGSGSSVDKLITEVKDTSLLNIGYPMLEDVDTAHSSETIYSVLMAQTQALLSVQKRLNLGFKTTVPADRDPAPGTYRLGETFQITVADDPVIADGVYTRRIAGLAGTETPWVTITDTDLVPTGS